MSNNRSKRILIIGGVAAGTSAASKARRIDPDSDIKIIQESVVSYGACGIPYVIEGLISNFEDLIERPVFIFKNKYDIDVITNTRASKIDRFRKNKYIQQIYKPSKIEYLIMTR